MGTEKDKSIETFKTTIHFEVNNTKGALTAIRQQLGHAELDPKEDEYVLSAVTQIFETTEVIFANAVSPSIAERKLVMCGAMLWESLTALTENPPEEAFRREEVTQALSDLRHACEVIQRIVQKRNDAA